MGRKIAIFDTTLRDGEQSPGASMNTDEKLVVCRQLLKLRVDVIEAGFPISSPGDFTSVRLLADEIGDAAVCCGLTRAIEKDIDVCADALKYAKRPRIHTGIGVSESHLRHKLKITEEECLERTAQCVAYARNLCDDVEFYAEDAGRSSYEFLARVLEVAVASGATVVNIPDTTGYSLPDEFGRRIAYIMEHVKGIEDVTVSVHCHNDLGMATALALAGVSAGATQVECTINGLGERAGNTAMEEVVMAIKMHGQELDAQTDVCTSEFARASRLVSRITGVLVQPNKAIVGANAFAHSSGIHQDGIIKERSTYEIIDPADVGAGASAIVLSARSGRAALRHRLEALGFDMNKTDFEEIYKNFLEMADKKKEVYDDDLQALIGEHDRNAQAVITLQSLQISCGTDMIPTATVRLADRQGKEYLNCATGAGPIDAAYQAVDEIVQRPCELAEFSIQALTHGTDALGEVTVRIASDQGEVFIGRGSDGDVVVSATKAYVNALNRMLIAQGGEGADNAAELSFGAQGALQ